MFALGELYNLNANTFIFGPVNISGFGDDGAVEYVNLSEDDFEVIAGYDGGVVANAILSPAIIAEVKVRETSRTYQELGLLLQAQRTAMFNGTPIARYPWYHADAGNGDEARDTNCLIVMGPTTTKTNRFSVRSFKILLPNGKRFLTYGGTGL